MSLMDIIKNSNQEPFGIKLGDYKRRLAKSIAISGARGYLRPAIDWNWKSCSGAFVIFPEREPNPHMLIVGMSGYGKSTLCKTLIMEIVRSGKKIMVFDVHNEHGDVIGTLGGKEYDAMRAGINLLALDGVSVRERISDLVGIFTEAYRLGNVQAAMLSECLRYTYMRAGAYGKDAVRLDRIPTMVDLIGEIDVFIRRTMSPETKRTLLSMKRKLGALNNEAFNEGFVTLDELKTSVSSFSLAKLRGKEARAIYINELLKRLYLSMKENARESGIKYYIMLDETQFLIGSGSLAGDLVRKMIEEGRKYGVGLILATHSATNLHKQIVANASTFVSFHSSEPEEVDYVSNLLAGGRREMVERIKDGLNMIGRHEAIVTKSGLTAPVIISAQTAGEVHALMKEPKSRDTDRDLEDRILAFANGPVKMEVVREEFGERFEAITEKLIADGKIGKVIFNKKDGKEVWYMTRKGLATPEHEICVKKIADVLKENGIWCTVTHGGNRPNPDIIANVSDKKIAVEYETGRKSHGKEGVEAIKRMLQRRKEYASIVMFVNDTFIRQYRKNFESKRVTILSLMELEAFAESLAGEETNINKSVDASIPDDKQDRGDRKADED